MTSSYVAIHMSKILHFNVFYQLRIYVSMIFAEAHKKCSSTQSSVSVQPDNINHGM